MFKTARGIVRCWFITMHLIVNLRRCCIFFALPYIVLLLVLHYSEGFFKISTYINNIQKSVGSNQISFPVNTIKLPVIQNTNTSKSTKNQLPTLDSSTTSNIKRNATTSKVASNPTQMSNNGSISNDSIFTKCPKLKKPSSLKESQTFQPVVNGKVWVYSAYYDARLPKHRIRIIGISHVQHNINTLLCRMWYNHTSEPDVQTIAANDSCPYKRAKGSTGMIFSCLVKEGQVPYAVSLVHDKCDVTNVLPVINNYKKDWKPTSNFTVCGPIIHSRKVNYNNVINMIEVNSAFGADHFVFYNRAGGAKTLEYLNKYQQEGLVDVLQWPVPAGISIHYHAQVASLNDCYHRNLYKTKFIAIIDVDEVLVPNSVNSWGEVMSALQKNSTKKINSAIFRNHFFRADLQQPDVLNGTDATTAQKYGITALLTTLRDEKITKFKSHAKYIADPIYINIPGVHYPYRYLAEVRTDTDVPTSLAFLHHHRASPYYTAKKIIQDNSLLRHKDAILKRVAERHKKFCSNA